MILRRKRAVRNRATRKMTGVWKSKLDLKRKEKKTVLAEAEVLITSNLVTGFAASMTWALGHPTAAATSTAPAGRHSSPRSVKLAALSKRCDSPGPHYVHRDRSTTRARPGSAVKALLRDLRFSSRGWQNAMLVANNTSGYLVS